MGGELVEVGEVNFVRLKAAVIAGELAEVAGNADGTMAVGEEPSHRRRGQCRNWHR